VLTPLLGAAGNQNGCQDEGVACQASQSLEEKFADLRFPIVKPVHSAF